MVFKKYAKYYDLLYSDKKYYEESSYVISLIKEYSENARDILDIGCGTGIHASLIAQKGHNVIGMDLSSDMIEIANSKKYQNCEFIVGNILSFTHSNKYDVITSLFHVISYQTSNLELESALKNVSNHLMDKGVFIFDFWYTPAVLTQRPTTKIKHKENDEIKITRISEPVPHYNANIVDVNFELHIYDKISSNYEIVKELHEMRYLSIPELDFILEKCGMRSIKYEEWMTGKPPSEKTWGVCCIATNL